MFTQIDPRAPEKRFSFAVRINGEAGRQAAYEVSDVTPAPPGVSALERHLSATGDFAQFVVGMRRAFVKLCSA